MNRALPFRPYPEEIIDSPFGKLRVWYTGDHVGVDDSTRDGDGYLYLQPAPVHINNVAYHVRADLHCEAGVWGWRKLPGGWNELPIMSKHESKSYTDSYPSDSARKKFIAFVESTVIPMLATRSEFIREGKAISIENSLSSLADKLDKARKELADLETQERILCAAYTALQVPQA